MNKMRLLSATAVLAFGMSLAACDSAAENEVESQAEAIDEMAETQADAIEEVDPAAAEMIEDSGEETKDAMEDSADAMDGGEPG